MMALRKSNRMSGAQYKKALKQLALTQARAAVLLHSDERTSRRWANDERDVPGPVARFLRYLVAANVTGDEAIKVLEG